MTGIQAAGVAKSGPWWGTSAHEQFLLQDAARHFAFFRPSLDPSGGFHVQEIDGIPVPDKPRELHATTRMIHSFALAQLAGVPGADEMIDHGMTALWQFHRDTVHGGYLTAFAPGGGVADGRKLAYGHAFVLLAASSAKLAGHPDADRLLADIREVIETRFWDPALDRMNEEYLQDWQSFSTYRGMNANMHMAEALLGAAEATGEAEFARRARAIFAFFVAEQGGNNGWRLPEHYTAEWRPDPNYLGDPVFRPQGSTPGHSFEFARLMLQLWDLTGRQDAELLSWAEQLYDRAMADGRAPEGGIYYTVESESGAPKVATRFWWPLTEAIGAAAALTKAGVDKTDDYRAFWQMAEQLFIDKDRGGWFPEVDAKGQPAATQFSGKPDIYHSLQASLYPLLPGIAGLKSGLETLRGKMPG